MKNHWNSVRELFNNVREFFVDRKSYIFSCAMSLYSVSKAFGYINTTLEQDMAVFGFLGGLFGISHRAALARMKKEQH
tara:strand:- start:1094 stop:1327 length:234 start_codon:yes stop_codon:yes gene_type:complete